MKMLISLITAMILISSIATASPSVPVPIDGQIYSPNPQGWEVNIKNLDTGVSDTIISDEKGLFHKDWNNIDPRASTSQRYQISAGGKDAILTIEAGGIWAAIDLSGMICPAPTVREIEVIKEVPIEVIKEVPVEVIKEVPAPVDINYAVAFIAVIIGLTTGAGLKIYRKTDGSAAVQHKHKNVVGYHDPNIVHKFQPHKKGEIAPKYADVKGADGYYKYLG